MTFSRVRRFYLGGISDNPMHTGVNRVKMVIIDTGSSINIIYFDVFWKLELLSNDLTLMTYSMMRFIGDSISSLMTMNLHVTFKFCFKKILSKFIVVDIPSTYNVIIGRLTLNRLRVILSTYHMMIKFPMRASIGELRSNIRKSC